MYSHPSLSVDLSQTKLQDLFGANLRWVRFVEILFEPNVIYYSSFKVIRSSADYPKLLCVVNANSIRGIIGRKYGQFQTSL